MAIDHKTIHESASAILVLMGYTNSKGSAQTNQWFCAYSLEPMLLTITKGKLNADEGLGHKIVCILSYEIAVYACL